MKRFFGFKAFTKDLTCRGYQFEIGKTYECKEEIVICQSGFHFCKSLVDCYRFYPRQDDTRICKVEALGDVLTKDNLKYVTNKIKILKEVKNPRIETNISKTSSGFCNSGNWNSGNYNTGDRNSGNSNTGDDNIGNWNSGHDNIGNCNSGSINSGDRNTGSINSGDYNSGDWNSGDYNSGGYNTGNRNTGSINSGDKNTGTKNSGTRNSGNYNRGNWNSGDWNSGNWNSGVFNSITPNITMFNKITDWSYDDWHNSKAYFVMSKCPHTHSRFVDTKNMSDEEKEIHPEYILFGGYTKTIVVTEEEKQKWWDNLSNVEKTKVMSLPNFDPIIFKSCTGIQV